MEPPRPVLIADELRQPLETRMILEDDVRNKKSRCPGIVMDSLAK